MGIFKISFKRTQFMKEEDIIECVNHSFNGKFDDYAGYDFYFNRNKIDCDIYVKDVNADDRIIVENIRDIIYDDDYISVIQKGVKWDISKQPHAIISGFIIKSIQVKLI